MFLKGALRRLIWGAPRVSVQCHMGNTSNRLRRMLLYHKGLSYILFHVTHKTTPWATLVSGHLKEEAESQEVKVHLQSQETRTWALTSPISTYWATPIALSLLHSQQRPEQGTWEVFQGLTAIPWASPLMALVFSEGLYLATKVLRHRGLETSWKGEDWSPWESSDGIGRTLLFSVPPFFLLLAPPRHWEHKESNEWLVLISFTPLPRKIKHL